MLTMAACQSSEGNDGSNSTAATGTSKVPKATKAPEAISAEAGKDAESTPIAKPTEALIVPVYTEEELKSMLNISQSNEKYSYTIRWNEEWSYYVVLTRCKNTTTIPAHIDGIPVKVIGSGVYCRLCVVRKQKFIQCEASKYGYYEKVFWYDTSLEQIEIPDSVISIGKYAFGAPWYGTKWYKNLEEDFVIVGDGVLIKAPVEGATELVLPDGVKDISYGLFEEHETLERIVLPEGITVIPKKAFFSCDALTTVELPDGLKCIEEDAFADCFYLEEIRIPESVTRIDPNAFARNLWRCNNLNVIGAAGSYAETYVNDYMKAYEEAYIKGITMTFQVSE